MWKIITERTILASEPKNLLDGSSPNLLQVSVRIKIKTFREDHMQLKITMAAFGEHENFAGHPGNFLLSFGHDALPKFVRVRQMDAQPRFSSEVS